MAEHFPEILPWCRTSYGAASILVFGDAIITSDTGFHQGDPLASLLFSLVLHPVVLAIKNEVPSLMLNCWYLDDGTLVGSLEELEQAVTILETEGPQRGLILSTSRTTTPPARPKTTVWSPQVQDPNPDPLNKGVPRVNEDGIILLGTAIGSDQFIAQALQEKLDKVEAIISLLPNLADAQTEFCLLRSCLSIPKVMHILRTVNTASHPTFLANFDSLVREALTRILGAGIADRQWAQANLPGSMGGLGLRCAAEHGPAAFCSSFLSSERLVRQLLGTPDDEEPADLPQDALDALAAILEEEPTRGSLEGLTQKQLCLQVDQAHQRRLAILTQAAGDREVARMASLCLPFAASWLNCVPIPALGLHMRSNEFVAAIKFRLGMPVYSQEGECTFCGANNDIMGDNAMVCRIGGEPISRHNALRDALFNVAAEAGLSPVKEGRGILPDSERRPADIFIRNWAGGKDAAIDVTVIHPLQGATRRGAATTPGHALTVAYNRKMREAGELCRQQGIAFIPLALESLGGWHEVALAQVRKIGSALGRHTGQDEKEVTAHLISRCSLLLQKGTAALLTNRTPQAAGPVTGAR